MQEIAHKWLLAHKDAGIEGIEEEYCILKKALLEWEQLGLCGVILHADGHPVGMSVASEISPGIFDIHFEKTVPGYPHAWAFLVKSWLKISKSER